MRRQQSLVSQVCRALDQQETVASGDTLVVAVSGGADSVAMLHALATIGRYRLHIAHLNHGLRGAESDADAAYVASLAHKMAMPATISQADVPSNVRQRRRGLEDAARRARYSFLSEVASQANAAVVALGHTADDQAETLLLNLLRGAGLRGLRGMLALSEMRIDGDEGRNKSLRLFRPLLQVSRAEVEAYCRDNCLDYRLDSTNQDTSLRRNWVRQVVLPMLAQRYPPVRRTLARTASILARDYDYISSHLPVVGGNIGGCRDQPLEFELPGWLSLEPQEQRYLLQAAGRRLASDLDDLTAEHIEAARQTMSKGQVGAIVQWPHGLRLEKGYDRFIVMAGRDSRDASEADEEVVPVCLLIPGITLFGQWQIVAERRRGRCTAGGPWHADLRLTTAIANLSIRPRRPGDRMRPLGAPGPRKLQDILVDCKVPRSERAGWPLVTSGNDILWAPGCAMAEDARVLSPEDEVLCLRALPIDGNNKLYGPLVDTRQSQ